MQIPKLKDYFESDNQNVFINQNDFATLHMIDDVEVFIVIDEERLKERSESEYNGITTGMILYFVSVSSFPGRPKIGNTQTFDNRLMTIEDVLESKGLYEIVITQNRGE
jgi:hypothetical protein